MSVVDLVDRLPTLDEYLSLTTAVGWEDYVRPETATLALEHSLFAVVAEHEGRARAMARVIGDRGLFFYVQDVAVHPELQGHGVGRKLMLRVMDWLDDNAPERAFVGLFSASGKAPFYERFGFEAAPTGRPGMYQYVRTPARS